MNSELLNLIVFGFGFNLFKLALWIGVFVYSFRLFVLIFNHFLTNQYNQGKSLYEEVISDENIKQNSNYSIVPKIDETMIIKTQTKELKLKINNIKEKHPMARMNNVTCDLFKELEEITYILNNSILNEVVDFNLIELIVNDLYEIVNKKDFNFTMFENNNSIIEITKILKKEINRVNLCNSVSVDSANLYLKTENYLNKNG